MHKIQAFYYHYNHYISISTPKGTLPNLCLDKYLHFSIVKYHRILYYEKMLKSYFIINSYNLVF